LSTNDRQNSPMPTSEGVARELAGLKPDEQKRVWKAAVKTSPKGKKVTAKHLRETINKMLGQKPAAAQAKTVDTTSEDADPHKEVYRTAARVAKTVGGLFDEGALANELETVLQNKNWISDRTVKGLAAVFTKLSKRAETIAAQLTGISPVKGKERTIEAEVIS
jgi:hypothetical protein